MFRAVLTHVKGFTGTRLAMSGIVHIHRTKQPRRPHYIREWADRRRLSQADLARELGADKSIVSRWYSGSSPGVEWQRKIAALFHIEADAIFRHPDEDWLHRFLRNRTDKERERIRNMIEAAFPDETIKTGTRD
jgi:transcriptional regulator with XRE-family HTH domain